MWLTLGLLILCAAHSNTQTITMDDQVNIRQQYSSNIEQLIPCSANVTLQNTCSFAQLKHTLSDRIVGGNEAKRHAYPSMAALFYENDHICGGTILTQWHVLTAAHCVKHFKVRYMRIKVGIHNLYSEGEIYQVERAVIHKGYKSVATGYDIALLITKQRIKYTKNVSKACLLRSPPPSRAVLKAVGWGRTSQIVVSSEILMEVDLKQVPYQSCVKRWGRGPFPFRGSIICTFDRNRDSCQGDSGGPIFYYSPTAKEHLLVGLVSFGGTKCAGTMPSVNTAVTAFMEWITSTVSITKPKNQVCVV